MTLKALKAIGLGFTPKIGSIYDYITLCYLLSFGLHCVAFIPGPTLCHVT